MHFKYLIINTQHKPIWNLNNVALKAMSCTQRYQTTKPPIAHVTFTQCCMRLSHVNYEECHLINYSRHEARMTGIPAVPRPHSR